MMTVKEIADKFSISRTAVYNKINHSMKDDLKPYIVERDGLTHLMPEGVRLIGESMDRSKVKNEVIDEVESDGEQGEKEVDINHDISRIMSRLEHLESDYIKSLQDHINRLERELEKKNEQLEKKDQLLERRDDLLQNSQVLLKQHQEKIQELEGEVAKRSIWQRLKWW